MWIETSAEVYAVIWAKHGKDLSVHASYTDATGDGHSWSNGKPEMLTEWGFKSADAALIKVLQTKENKDDKDWANQFFIYSHTDNC